MDWCDRMLLDHHVVDTSLDPLVYCFPRYHREVLVLNEARVNRVMGHACDETAVTFHDVNRRVVLILSEADLYVEGSKRLTPPAPPTLRPFFVRCRFILTTRLLAQLRLKAQRILLHQLDDVETSKSGQMRPNYIVVNYELLVLIQIDTILTSNRA